MSLKGREEKKSNLQEDVKNIKVRDDKVPVDRKETHME